MSDVQRASLGRRVLLLDGHNLLYRAFTSLPMAITGPDGQPINAVYGMLSTIIKLSRDHGAEHAVAAFDVPHIPTFRRDLYPAYQAQRGPLGSDHAEEFLRQVDLAQRILPLTSVPALTAPRYEADDIMGTLAIRLAGQGDTALIVSTDRDLLQLVRPGVEVLAPGTKGVHARTAADVLARLNVAPEGITTLKALAGDASDNIPGVRGIGMKTAADLANTHGSLEGIYQALGSLPARTARLLVDGKEDAYLFRRLVTVVTDVGLPPVEESLPVLPFGAGTRAREILNRHT
ncbi:MAG: hypothetical protein M3Z66_06975 [Chloroflexota bacterium]|nr:hypothetical protein [Chloroflexota bacterium]